MMSKYYMTLLSHRNYFSRSHDHIIFIKVFSFIITHSHDSDSLLKKLKGFVAPSDSNMSGLD